MPIRLSGDDALENGQNDNVSFMSTQSFRPAPDTMSKLIARIRALIFTLLPVEVDIEDLKKPSGRVLTPQVVSTFRAAAGDFEEMLPYALLRARTEFMWDAGHDTADYDENVARAVACEVLARRIVHKSPQDRIASIMSSRHSHREQDGDVSELCSVLELAIDTHCTIFLSSSESQDVVNDLWNGVLVQRYDNHDVDFYEYEKDRGEGFWDHLEPSRLSVPKYQNIFRISIWLIFLVVYSQAVREPLEKLDRNHLALDEWEVLLYLMAVSFLIESGHRLFKLSRFVSWRAFNFWSIVSLLTNIVFAAAFIIRLVGIFSHGDRVPEMRLRSFQVLSFAAPLIWMKLITVFDGMKYIGTMQICVARMLQESGIFFALLSVLGLGFAQALYALDAADGQTEPATAVVNVLVQALLQAPDYGNFPGTGQAGFSAGLVLYYFWNVVTVLILLNVLISLFASAYSDVVDDAEAQYLAFFAGKTISMIRAPDSFVYPAPYNLIELFFIAPFECLGRYSMSETRYRKLNRFVMSVLFFVPLVCIALYESSAHNPKRHAWVRSLFTSDDQGAADSPQYRDPEVDDSEEEGRKISKVRFSQLVKAFPDATQSAESIVVREIAGVKSQLEELMKKLDEMNSNSKAQ